VESVLQQVLQQVREPQECKGEALQRAGYI